EAQAGVALRPDYWLRPVRTPLGFLSRRSILLTVLGMILWAAVVLLAAGARLAEPPSAVTLPRADAFTVMTHVHANFAMESKDPLFAPFDPPPAENWRFQDAYRFSWRRDGNTYTALVLSYANLDTLLGEYLIRTQAPTLANYRASTSITQDSVLELRDTPDWGNAWSGTHLGNALLLISPGASEADKQQLRSHFATILAAEHREVVPTPTP
ncbi:MAG: hypothetical protein HC915_17190, partial [Anaerolineae bacterium]|nr:hypothetical protein [Anaerolineae bacterium]